jgi:hypothetical protein
VLAKGLRPDRVCVTPADTSGGGEIRTRERLTASPVFKTGAIGRSATPPSVDFFQVYRDYLKLEKTQTYHFTTYFTTV